MKTNKTKVILTDVDSRKAFDIVNIMERHYGYECIFCSSKDFQIQLPIIYFNKIYRLRNTTFELFSKDFEDLLNIFNNYTLVYLPISEKPTRFFYQFIKTKHNLNLFYLLPNELFFNITADKLKFQEFCENNNFPIPKSYKKVDLSNLRKNFRPLILKPKSGQGSVGIRYINQVNELLELYDINFEDYVLQEKIQSKDQVSGAFFLCNNGAVVCSHTHQRLRTFPKEGGVTVYSKSTSNKEILSIGSSLLKHLNWSGVAMIEFMYDEISREWKIIELNPRLWGSIMLSTFNGSDILKKYIDYALDNDVKLESHKTLKDNYIRWIFPFDFINFFKGKLSIRDFFTLNLSTTCYINFTYSSFYRSIAYMIYFTFNFSSIKRFFKKLT